MIRDTSARTARIQGSSWAGHTTPEPVHRAVQGVPEYQLDCFRASPGAVPDGQQSGWLVNLAWNSVPASLLIVLPKTVLQAKAQTIRSTQKAERCVSINLGARTYLNCISSTQKHLIFCCRSQDSYILVLPHNPASEAALEMVKHDFPSQCSFIQSVRLKVPRGYQREKSPLNCQSRSRTSRIIWIQTVKCKLM